MKKIVKVNYNIWKTVSTLNSSLLFTKFDNICTSIVTQSTHYFVLDFIYEPELMKTKY